jgi:hypothetical protein
MPLYGKYAAPTALMPGGVQLYGIFMAARALKLGTDELQTGY